MRSEKCPRFEECSAPLCPLDKSLKQGIWYPDQEICKRKGFGDRDFIKAQKKIVKVKSDPNYYFTIQMLKRNCKIGKGMCGIDPDETEKPQLQNWLKVHPVLQKRTLSPKQIKSQRKFSDRSKKGGFVRKDC